MAGRKNWLSVELDRVFEHLFGELEASSEQMCITGTSCEEEMHKIKRASVRS